jgi:predicted porin
MSNFTEMSMSLFTRNQAGLPRKALFTALALALSANAFAGFPTLYGKVQVTAGQYDFEKINFAPTAPGATTYTHIGATDISTELDSFTVESIGSRLGVQGDFDAAAGVNIFYRVEYGVDYDNGTNSNGRELVQRNIFGGIRGSWGAVLAGKNDTPLRSLAGRNGTIVKNAYVPAVQRTDIDRFNEAPLADIGTYLVGENRPDNVIQYTSPILLGGLEINIAAIQSEETGVSQSATNPQDDNQFASGKAFSIGYGKTNWFIGAAYESNVATSDTARVVGEVTLGPVKLGAIYQTAERHEDFDSLGGFTTFVNATTTTIGAQNGVNPLSEWDGTANTAYKEQEGFVFNGVWKIAGPWSAKFQVANSTSTPTNDAYEDVELDALALGLDYALNDATRIFTYYAEVEAQGDTAISTQATTDNIAALGLDFRF